MTRTQPFFTLNTECSTTQARAGTIVTDHGEIPTPIFMPVGTQGAVKAMNHDALRTVNASIILANTYHLYLRPGVEVLKAMGGLHKMSGWDRPLLTDSGGFQVWSLSQLRKLTNDGVEFQSHLDGSKHLFTPESVVDVQRAIGSDIFMVLDECTNYPATVDEARTSMQLTLDWAQRSATYNNQTEPLYNHRQFQFAIGQGSVYPDLRTECMNSLVEIDFDGYAIGGLSVGEPAEQMYEITEASTAVMPKHKPRYLMGVGTPENILTAIGLGVDMFDCVMPTRNARNGTIFTTTGKVNIKNAKWRLRDEALDSGLDNDVSQNTSMAYLRHLINANEIVGLMIATQQNVALYLWLVQQARAKIIDGSFRQWAPPMIEQLSKQRD